MRDTVVLLIPAVLGIVNGHSLDWLTSVGYVRLHRREHDPSRPFTKGQALIPRELLDEVRLLIADAHVQRVASALMLGLLLGARCCGRLGRFSIDGWAQVPRVSLPRVRDGVDAVLVRRLLLLGDRVNGLDRRRGCIPLLRWPGRSSRSDAVTNHHPCKLFPAHFLPPLWFSLKAYA